MRRIMLLLLTALGLTCYSTGDLNAHTVDRFAFDVDDAGKPVLSETDTYMDLKTGKVFKVMYDDLNSIYNREDLLAFDLYVNTRTNDTFWLEEAVKVNNALVRDAAGNYRVDPMKVKRDGAGYKVINNATDKQRAPHKNAEKGGDSDTNTM